MQGELFFVDVASGSVYTQKNFLFPMLSTILLEQNDTIYELCYPGRESIQAVDDDTPMNDQSGVYLRAYLKKSHFILDTRAHQLQAIFMDAILFQARNDH